MSHLFPSAMIFFRQIKNLKNKIGKKFLGGGGGNEKQDKKLTLVCLM